MSIRNPIFYLIVAFIFMTLACQEHNQDDGTSLPKDKKNQAPVSSKVRRDIKGTEKEVAGSDDPYLILDLVDKTLKIKMVGTILKEIPFQLEDDSLEFRELRDDLSRNKIDLCRIEKVHLFAAAEKFGDTLVTIISSATNAPKEKIQHYIPQNMTIICSNDIVISVVTDINGKTLSFWQNQVEQARLIGKKFLTGADLIHLRLNEENAMSLYGVSRRGTGIIIVY